jgi:two-component system OmpR family sensor kinase
VLVDNARKHAPDGATTITVRRTGALVEIAVADDGPGIPPGERERSFAPGHRGARSHGQGLGLHLARSRLQHCQGSLELAPSPHGSTFVVRLAADLGDGCHDLDVREAM